MSSASPRRRLTLALTVGALVGLTTLAMPTVATAAEVCVASTTPTAETQPWQTFAESPNQFVLVQDAYEGMLAPIAAQLATVDADFTQNEFTAMQTAVGAAFIGAGESANAAVEVFAQQEEKLQTDLLAADPTHEAENQAILDGMSAALENSSYGTTLNTVFTTYLSELGTYLESVQAAITASTPRPTVPGSLTAASDALAAGVVGLGDFIQVNVYDAAGAQVVFPQVCTTVAAAPTLAATGSNDVAPIALGGALLLLAGAAGVIAARRRTGATL